MDRTIGKSENRNNDGERLMISLLEIAQSINEVDDDKIIKYKDKDGESQEMTAGAAKKMDKDHPAKQAWDKMSAQDKGDDDSEKDDGGKLGGGDFDRDGGDEPDMDSDGGDEEKSAESENEKIISALEDMDLPDGFNVDSLDSAIDSGQYASITGKDDDPDNEMNVNAFTGEDGKVEYGINIGSGHDMIYFNSKEEAIEATEKLLDDATIRDAMNGESDPAGVTLADLGDHAKNVLKSDDDESKPIPAAPMETKVINGVKYRAIKESKKPKKHILKENYDRFFGDK